MGRLLIYSDAYMLETSYRLDKEFEAIGCLSRSLASSSLIDRAQNGYREFVHDFVLRDIVDPAIQLRIRNKIDSCINLDDLDNLIGNCRIVKCRV